MNEERTILAVAIVIPLVLMVLAFFKLWSNYLKIKNSERFISDFRNTFIAWCNSNFSDPKLYNKIIFDSSRAQTLMGGFGLMDHKPPFANYVNQDWPIILNAIPAIRHHRQDGISYFGFYVTSVDEALLRRLGDFDHRLQELRRSMKNPLRLFHVGLTLMLTLPFLLLTEFGLMTKIFYDRISSSVIVRAITVAVTIIGFAAAVFTIVSGWEQFKVLVISLLGSIV